MKIFCIGRNYVEHAKELNNSVPTQPLIFMKPPTALLHQTDFYYPEFTSNLHYECELVVKIKKNGKHIKEKFATDYISEVSLGIDFTARDLQSELKKKGHPWEIAKGFDGSAPIGKFFPVESFDLSNTSFQLLKNGQVVQDGTTKHLIFSIPYLIHYLSKYFTLQTGDLIFTGTPAGVGEVAIGDQLTGHLAGETVLEVNVK